MTLKFTVVTPSYNHAHFIEDTLQSIANQKYPNLELIVMDGGSKDGTVEIVERYQGLVSHFVSEPDNGQTDALIKGFNLGTGDIFAWLNSDDLYEPGTLTEVASYSVENPDIDFVYGDATWIDKAGKRIRPKKEIPFNRFIWTYDYNYLPQPSTFWKRSLYEESGGLDISFSLAMDGDLWDRMSRISRPRHVKRYWSQMRLYPEQKNQAFRARSNIEDNLIRERAEISTDGLMFKIKRPIAKTARIAWKLCTGCYGG